MSDLDKYGINSGRIIGEDGEIYNVVDLLSGGVAAAIGGGIYNIEQYGKNSGRVIGEDGNVYNIVDLLKALTSPTNLNVSDKLKVGRIQVLDTDDNIIFQTEKAGSVYVGKPLTAGDKNTSPIKVDKAGRVYIVANRLEVTTGDKDIQFEGNKFTAKSTGGEFRIIGSEEQYINLKPTNGGIDIVGAGAPLYLGKEVAYWSDTTLYSNIFELKSHNQTRLSTDARKTKIRYNENNHLNITSTGTEVTGDIMLHEIADNLPTFVAENNVTDDEITYLQQSLIKIVLDQKRQIDELTERIELLEG